jgi:hypothetical protein
LDILKRKPLPKNEASATTAHELNAKRKCQRQEILRHVSKLLGSLQDAELDIFHKLTIMTHWTDGFSDFPLNSGWGKLYGDLQQHVILFVDEEFYPEEREDDVLRGRFSGVRSR